MTTHDTSAFSASAAQTRPTPSIGPARAPNLAPNLAWFRPGLPIVAGSCALVGTAGILGFHPVLSTILGIPTGLWIVAAINTAAWAAARGPQWLEQFEPVTNETSTPTTIRDAVEAVAEPLAPEPHEPSELSRLSQKYCERLDKTHWNGSALRIGVERGAPAVNAIAALRGEVDVDWIDVAPGAPAPITLRRYRLDALLTSFESTGLQVVTPEHAGREAAWFDWSTQRPISYASVFPVRLDPARVTVHHIDLSCDGEVDLVAALVRSAAALSRVPARLSLTDRLHGRMPSTGFNTNGEDTRRHAADRALEELALRLCRLEQRSSNAAIIAARVVSAWAATASGVTANLRREAAEASLAIASTETEVTLRAIACRMGQGDDTRGFALLQAARDGVAARASELLDDQTVLVQAELETAGADPLAIGRLVAGIALVAGAATPERLAMLRDDFADDANHATWLVGRDSDRVLLLNAFRRVEGVAALRLAPSGEPESITADAASAVETPMESTVPEASTPRKPKPKAAKKKAKSTGVKRGRRKAA